jgi:hypothetical protein
MMTKFAIAIEFSIKKFAVPALCNSKFQSSLKFQHRIGADSLKQSLPTTDYFSLKPNFHFKSNKVSNQSNLWCEQAVCMWKYQNLETGRE